MIDNIDIRDSRPSDLAAIETLYPEVFPEEDLLPVVRELLSEGTTVLSLVGLAEATLVGHVVFTPCAIVGRPQAVALLAPLAVAPTWQRRGIGSAIVQSGLQRLAEAGTRQVYVLGDPAYYGRFGFRPDHGVNPPYPLPEAWRDAWQSLGLGAETSPLSGTLSVPPPWRQRSLWEA